MSVTLATSSEFGLIVAVVSVNRDMIAPEWTSAIGVAVALSFALGSRTIEHCQVRGLHSIVQPVGSP